MARLTARYLIAKRNQRPGPDGRGTVRWYWQPTPALAAAGWPRRRLRRPDGAPVAELGEAVTAAEAINAELDAWRNGAARGPDAAPGRDLHVAPGSIAALVALYKASPRFARLAPKTRRDYDWCLRLIEARWGPGPARALSPLAVQEFYASMYDATPAKANAVIRVLRLLLEFARRANLVPLNVAAKPGLIGTAPRLRIWTPAEVAAMAAAADAAGLHSIGDAVLLALYTGQRRGDLLRLPRFHCAEGRIRLRQSKRRAQIDIRQTPRLAARLAAAEARIAARWPHAATILVCEPTGQAWHEDTFTKTFAAVRAAAAAGDVSKDGESAGRMPCPSVADAWFMDLRDTAITNLAAAGATIPEICAISGHSERSAHQILRHYLALNPDMADSAIAKLIAWEDRAAAQTHQGAAEGGGREGA
jgi:integrase